MRAWTAPAAAQRSRQRIESVRRAARDALAKVACDWGDENSFLEQRADEVIAAIEHELDEFRTEIDETMADAARDLEP